MTDTIWADVSEFQRTVDDSYPYRVLAIRSNDGTYRDAHFAANFAWAKKAHAAGKLDVLIVYLVWRPNWLDAVNTHKAMVGTPPPWVVSMIDVESWQGQIGGNQSVGVNGARENLISWHGGNRRKVIGYANAADFATLWPTRGDARVILANYSSNPTFPNKIGHQFSDAYSVPPFGPCDGNSADGLTPAQFAAALGIGAPQPAPSTDQGEEMALSTQAQAQVKAIVHAEFAAVFKGKDGKVWPLENLIREALADVIGNVQADLAADQATQKKVGA